MTDNKSDQISAINAPFGQEITLREMAHDNGATLLQVRIREGKRFTVFEIDAVTAKTWGRAMVEWADTNGG